METLIIAAAFIGWNAIGFYGGVLLVTETDDFTPDDCIFALWMGLGGPLILLIVLLSIATERNSEKVLFRRRGK